jgi:hypothetical protein
MPGRGSSEGLRPSDNSPTSSRDYSHRGFDPYRAAVDRRRKHRQQLLSPNQRWRYLLTSRKIEHQNHWERYLPTPRKTERRNGWEQDTIDQTQRQMDELQRTGGNHQQMEKLLVAYLDHESSQTMQNSVRGMLQNSGLPGDVITIVKGCVRLSVA